MNGFFVRYSQLHHLRVYTLDCFIQNTMFEKIKKFATQEKPGGKHSKVGTIFNNTIYRRKRNGH